MLGDLASDGTVQSIKNASLRLEAEGEEGRWDVTVCIKLDILVKSIRDSPRPSKTQGVPPVPPKNTAKGKLHRPAMDHVIVARLRNTQRL